MLSNIFKFLVGFFFALLLLVAGSVAGARYFITKMTAPPPKPIFANDKPTAPEKAATPAKAATPKPAASAPEKPALPPNAYEARVTWSDGLILRDGAGAEANRIGGIAYNQKIVVLEESADKAWQRVRIGDGQQEGWIKAGNTERIN